MPVRTRRQAARRSPLPDEFEIPSESSPVSQKASTKPRIAKRLMGARQQSSQTRNIRKPKGTHKKSHSTDKPPAGRRGPIATPLRQADSSQRSRRSVASEATQSEARAGSRKAIEHARNPNPLEEGHPKWQDMRVQRRAELEQARESKENPVHALDIGNNWNVVTFLSEKLSAGSFRSPDVRRIAKSAQKLKTKLMSTTSTTDLQDQLNRPNNSFATLCEQLTGPLEYSDGILADFCGDGLKSLIEVLGAIFQRHRSSLLNHEELFVLTLSIRLMHSIIAFADSIRSLIKSNSGTVLKSTFSTTAAGIIGRLRALVKSFEQEAFARERSRNLRSFESAYKEAHRRLALRKSQRADARRHGVEKTLPASIQQSTGNTIEWTVRMDEELVQCLYQHREIPLPERYRRCLLTPSLQNLLDEHIRMRALAFRPSLMSWYEEHGQAAPLWVTSID